MGRCCSPEQRRLRRESDRRHTVVRKRLEARGMGDHRNHGAGWVAVRLEDLEHLLDKADQADQAEKS